VKQGWEPLCQFLGKEVPDKPFPKVFETNQYRETIQKMQKIRGKKAARRASVVIAIVTVIFGGVGWKIGTNFKMQS
jgi:Sulfotransferase domain